MMVGLQTLSDGEYDAFVSSGGSVVEKSDFWTFYPHTAHKSASHNGKFFEHNKSRACR